ncbi:MAG: DUF4254 domain-containing protein, partial [Flavobacteriales bacterium]|nr:DUF4254 domain-containing protein [Flavobacteriales bacterium]
MTKHFNEIFDSCIRAYHITNDVDATIHNHYDPSTLEHLLYAKNWIDTVQWHLEDIIRREDINPLEALAIKRRIDASNQDRTDMVEYIDSFFLEKYKKVKALSSATMNTESPAWA